jgi:cell shape-determining protein MreD
MKLAATIIFLLSFLLESSVTTLPLVFLTLLCLAVLIRKEWIFAVAFLAGLVLDVFSFRLPGQSSLYFIVYIFLVFLYQRKFEIATKYFIFAASFFGSLIFLIIFSYNNLFLQSLISSIIGVLIFAILSKFQIQSSKIKI